MSEEKMTDMEQQEAARRKRNGLIALGLAVLILVCAWFSSLVQPAAPVQTPAGSSDSSSEAPEKVWYYPDSNVMYSLEVDDFRLSVDGSFTINSSYEPGGVSAGYLENCLQLEPEVPFTVEPLGEGRFKINLENGRQIPRTKVTLPKDPKSQYGESFSGWIEPHLAVRLNTREGNGGVAVDQAFTVEFSYPMQGIETPENLITLVPEFPCAMEGSDRLITITPDEFLQYGATYAVNVSGNVTAVNGKKFNAEQQLTFDTESQDFSLIITNQGVSTTRPGDKIEMEYQLDTAQRGPREGKVTLYSIDSGSVSSFEAYLNFLKTIPKPDLLYTGKGYGRQEAIYQTGPGAIPPEALTEIDSWSGKMPEGLSTVTFENPGEGFYVLCTTLTDTKTGDPIHWYKPVQVVTPSVYMQSLNGESLFWLNDAKTGDALPGYTIRFVRGDFESELASGVTGSDGCAIVNIPTPQWVQDDSQNSPIPGEQLYRFTGFPDETASLTPEEADRRNRLCTVFVIYNAQGRPIYADSTASLSDAGLLDNRYYSVFYLDRALYRPTDEIHFWGFLKPYLQNTAPPPSQLEVSFDPDGLDQKVTVQVQPDGAYSGVIQLDKMVSGEYYVAVQYTMSEAERALRAKYYSRFGGAYGQEEARETVRNLESEWIEVKEFQKPAYTIETRTDKPIYHWGDTATVTVTPTFFDGTPAPHLPLECSLFNTYTGGLEQATQVQTDENGVATFQFKVGDAIRPDTDYTLEWTPRKAYFYVKITSEGENVTAQGHYNYVPGKFALRSKLEFDEGDNAVLTVLLNEITLENIHSEEDLKGMMGWYYADEDLDARYGPLIGKPADGTVTAELHTYYCRPYDGSYDEKYYDYVSAERRLSIDVKDGKAVVENVADYPRREKTYMRVYTHVSYNNPADIKVDAYADAENRYPQYESKDDEQIKGYSFNVYRNNEESPSQMRESYWLRDFVEAGAGDSLRFALCKDGKEVAGGSGRLLYTLVHDHVISHTMGSQSFSLTVNPSMANNLLVVAAYFDGKEVYPVTNCEVDIDSDSMELTIETKADKEAYLPGDTVTLETKVTDLAGNPVSANLCVSVVDEAVFALREQYVDLLNSLYSDFGFYNFFISKYTTLTGDIDPYNAGGDGGKGDGDNLLAYDVFRKNFKDTALFYPTHSDTSGNAAVTFTLPDNITSWRVTTLAVDSRIYGGQSRSQVITTLPFFVKPVLSSEYIEGDEVAMQLQGHGNALEEDSLIDYTVKITGDGVDNTQTMQGKAYEPILFNFGKLPQGEYTVTASGKFGERRDTVEQTIAVITSNLELTVHEEFDPNKPLGFKVARYPVYVTLYNTEDQAYYDCINALLLQYCNRLDQRMSRYVAKRVLLRTTSEENLPQNLKAADDLSLYQRDDGSIGWYAGDNGWPGEDANASLSLQAMLAAGEEFSSQRLKMFFAAAAADSAQAPEEQAAAIAGLAILEPSQIQTIHARLESSPPPTAMEQLYYGVGLAYAGDLEGAGALYEQVVEPNLDRRGTVSRLTDVGEKWEENRATALAWLIAAKLGLEDADQYARYFTQDRWMNSAALFACMVYVRNYPLDPAQIQFSYTDGTGTAGTIDLSVNGAASLTLTRSQLEGFSFQDVPEGISGRAFYIGEPEEASLTPSPELSIRKDVKALDNGKYENTIVVQLSKDAPYGFYSISDWIPSNMRLNTVRRPAQNTIWTYWSQEGQKMDFQFYHTENDGNTVVITYDTQRVYDTTAVVDRTYLVCGDTGENAFTERHLLE